MRFEEIAVLVNAITGIANRHAPLIYIDYDGFFGKQKHFGDEVPAATAHFRSFYSETRGLLFQESLAGLDALLRRTAPLFDGIVLYPDEDVEQMTLAINLANVRQALPMSERLYAELGGCLGSFVVLERLQSMAGGIEEIYERMMQEIWPECDRTLVYSLGYYYFKADGPIKPVCYTTGLDFAFYKKCPIFFMSCNERHRGAYDFMLQGSKREYALYSRVMEQLEKLAAIMGWNEPEWRFALTATRFGHFVYCTDGASNLSFHAAVPPMQSLPYIMNKGNRRRVRPRKRCTYPL